MKENEIIYNTDNLNESDINETNEKVRLLIINSNGEILVGNYDKYLLPGGKVEDNESIF